MTKKVNFKRDAKEMKVDLSLALSEIVEGVDTIKNYLDLLVFVDDDCKMKAPYTEQRKWIGKLCWFWNENTKENKKYKVLNEIIQGDHYKYYDCDCIGWEHCEPVNPDDDVIYKGV